MAARNRFGVAHVLDQFKPGPEAATALAFVATLIKDYGAVDESVLLYHATVMMDPTNRYVIYYIFQSVFSLCSV